MSKRYATPPLPVKKQSPADTQIKFRCPAALHGHLEMIKITTGQSTQQICVDALTAYLHRDVGAKKLTHDEWLAHLQETIDRNPDIFKAQAAQLYDAAQQRLIDYVRENEGAFREAMHKAGIFPAFAESYEEQLWMQFWGQFMRSMPPNTVGSLKQVMFDLMDLFASSGRKKADERSDANKAQ